MANAKSYSNSNPDELAKALAAARANVRGTGRMERAKPSVAEEEDRTPNWNKVRLIPRLEAWKCAALWANIDPDKVKFKRDAWMMEGSVHCFDESHDFKDRVELVEANEFGALKTKGHGIDVRLFAAWVREVAHEKGWPAPPELLAMADEHDSGEQNSSMPAEGNANVGQRAHNKQVTQDRNHAWQERIDKLAQESPGKSHANYCRSLANEIGVGISFQTIRRNTRRPRS